MNTTKKVSSEVRIPFLISSLFHKHLEKAKNILTEYAKTKRLHELLQKDLRTPFFMLQGLARIFCATESQMNAGKPFKKWLTKFKTIEDLLGQISFHTLECKQWRSRNAEASTTNEERFYTGDNASKEHKLALELYRKLSIELKEEEWVTGMRISKINEKLIQIDNVLRLRDPETGIASIEQFLKREISEIINFHKTCTYTHMEEHVHELRRELRWISIYATALNGLVQLKGNKTRSDEKKYLTDEIVNSPFNKMPEKPKSSRYILFNKNSFFALSWLINELGEIKDEGLQLMHYNESKKADKDQVKNNKGKMSVLLASTKDICTTFFEEGHLQRLLIQNS